MFQGCRSKCHGHAMIVISRNPGTWLPPGPFPFPNQGSISFSFQQITQFAQFLYQRLDPIGFFNPQGLHSPEQKWNTPHTTSHSKRLDEIGHFHKIIIQPIDFRLCGR